MRPPRRPRRRAALEHPRARREHAGPSRRAAASAAAAASRSRPRVGARPIPAGTPAAFSHLPAAEASGDGDGGPDARGGARRDTERADEGAVRLRGAARDVHAVRGNPAHAARRDAVPAAHLADSGFLPVERERRAAREAVAEPRLEQRRRGSLGLGGEGTKAVVFARLENLLPVARGRGVRVGGKAEPRGRGRGDHPAHRLRRLGDVLLDVERVVAARQ